MNVLEVLDEAARTLDMLGKMHRVQGRGMEAMRGSVATLLQAPKWDVDGEKSKKKFYKEAEGLEHAYSANGEELTEFEAMLPDYRNSEGYHSDGLSDGLRIKRDKFADNCGAIERGLKKLKRQFDELRQLKLKFTK